MEQKQLPKLSLNTTVQVPDLANLMPFNSQAENPVAPPPSPDNSDCAMGTIELAAKDVRDVLEQQRGEGNTMTTKLNILFVVNGALLTSLTLSRLMYVPSPFSFAEILGFLVNFCLLINAFLPRQVAISPNLRDQKFLERYLPLTPEEYQMKMMVNLVQTYNANKQRLDDVSQSLTYAAYVTLTLALVIMFHVVATYFIPGISIQIQ